MNQRRDRRPSDGPAGEPEPDREEILARMDLNFLEMWREMARRIDGAEVHERDGLTIVSTPRGEAVHNPVLVGGATSLAELEDALARWVRPLGRPFSVFTRDHDARDVALSRDLVASGWIQPFAEPGMALTAADWRARASSRQADAGGGELELRPAECDGDIVAYGRMLGAAYGVYGMPASAVEAFFTRIGPAWGASPRTIVGWVAGRAACGATLYASHGVAGIGWVGTHPDLFGRGYGRRVVAAVIEEGFRLGLGFANLQASIMAQRMYEHMGFTVPTWYRIHLPPLV